MPGTVTLRIERLRAKNAVRPPLFVIGGGAGESATRSYGSFLIKQLIGTEVRARDAVVIDPRGTGRSGVLRCRSLERVLTGPRAEAAAACAGELGDRRAFYTARDSAEDIEAVRVALGVPRIALLAYSHGARVALEYARRHPANVERLALGPADGPDGVDPLLRSSFVAVPRVLRHLCPPSACHRSTRDLVADTSKLAERLARKPLRGTVVDSRGRHRPAAVDAAGLFEVLMAGDELAWTARSEFPGLVRNALRGDPAPLLRARATAQEAGSITLGPRDVSPAAEAATICEESVFPWSRSAPLGDRERQTRELVDALPVGAFAPFGTGAALGSKWLDLCRLWPVASSAPEPLQSLPSIPALVVTQEHDLRFPVENGEAIARLLSGAQVLHDRGGIPGMPAFFNDCGRRGLRRFLAGGRPDACPRRAFTLPVSKPPPLRLAEVPPVSAPGRPGRTFAAARLSLVDGSGSAGRALVQHLVGLYRRDRTIPRKVAFTGTVRAGGLRGGSVRLALKSGRLRFERVSYVPGVRLSGWVSSFFKGPQERGVLNVSGPRASRGRLVIRKGRVRGTLGGRTVRGRLFPPYNDGIDRVSVKQSLRASLATVRR